MANWIEARNLRKTDVLEFQAVVCGRVIDGIPIKKLRLYEDGKVEVDVIHIDGTQRYMIFDPDAQVAVVKRA